MLEVIRIQGRRTSCDTILDVIIKQNMRGPKRKLLRKGEGVDPDMIPQEGTSLGNKCVETEKKYLLLHHIRVGVPQHSHALILIAQVHDFLPRR